MLATERRVLLHDAFSGMRQDELKGTKRGQLSFFTSENPVRASGLWKLTGEIGLSVSKAQGTTINILRTRGL